MWRKKTRTHIFNKYLVSKNKGCLLNAHQLEANNNQWNVKKPELISPTNTFYVYKTHPFKARIIASIEMLTADNILSKNFKPSPTMQMCQLFISVWLFQLLLVKVMSGNSLNQGLVCFYLVNSAKSVVILCYLNFPENFEPHTKRWE